MTQGISRLPCPGGGARECLRSGLHLTLLTCSVVAAFVADLGAQFQAEVRFANRTPFSRHDWQTATVPFPRGVWTAGKTFIAENLPSEVAPFGARWPDGSVRFGRLDVLLHLDPFEEKIVKVLEGRRPQTPLRLGPMLLANLSRFGWKISASIPGVGMRSARLRFHSVVHASNVRSTVLYRDRIPDTDLVYDLWLTLHDDQDYLRFELRLTNADTTSPRWRTDFDFVALITRGCVPNVRAARPTAVRTLSRSLTGDNLVELLGRGWLYDGQACEWWGELLFLDPNTTVPGNAQRLRSQFAAVGFPAYGVALNWAESGAFGPFGHLPPAPPWVVDNGRAAAMGQRARFESLLSSPGDPWADRGLGLLKDPSWTGDQYDFGAAKLVDVFRSGMPDRIEEARYHAGEEALRPVHFREPDGSPLRSVNHPDWVPWNGRSHYDSTVCPDRLGKPSPAPPFTSNSAHGWAGRDRQHWSSLTLASAYLLTCSHSLRMELDNEAELYMAGHTLPSVRPNWSTNGIGAPRGVGRTSLSMAWNYLCTGRTDLRSWLVERLRQCNLVQTFGLSVPGPVKPLGLHPADPRIIANSTNWRPWEDAQAVMGLEAAIQVTGFVQAAPLVYMGAKTLMSYGWKIDQQQRVLVAIGMAWLPGGTPLSAAQLNDPNFTRWSYGTAFSEWSLPAVKIALRYGLTVGDTHLARTSWFVLQNLHSQRSMPPGGGWDRFAEWDAVR